MNKDEIYKLFCEFMDKKESVDPASKQNKLDQVKTQLGSAQAVPLFDYRDRAVTSPTEVAREVPTREEKIKAAVLTIMDEMPCVTKLFDNLTGMDCHKLINDCDSEDIAELMKEIEKSVMMYNKVYEVLGPEDANLLFNKMH